MKLKNRRAIEIVWLLLALVSFLSTGCDIVVGVQRTGTHDVVTPEWATGWPSPPATFPFRTPTPSPQTTTLPTPSPSPTATLSCPQGDYELQFIAGKEEVGLLVSGESQPQDRWSLAEFENKLELLNPPMLKTGESLQPTKVQDPHKALRVISGGKGVGWVELHEYVVRIDEHDQEVSPRWYYSRCGQWHQ